MKILRDRKRERGRKKHTKRKMNEDSHEKVEREKRVLHSRETHITHIAQTFKARKRITRERVGKKEREKEKRKKRN